jgi:hypothetical protein
VHISVTNCKKGQDGKTRRISSKQIARFGGCSEGRCRRGEMVRIVETEQRKDRRVEKSSKSRLQIAVPSFPRNSCLAPTVQNQFLQVKITVNSSGVYICKKEKNDLKHGNYICKSEVKITFKSKLRLFFLLRAQLIHHASKRRHRNTFDKTSF